MAATSPKAKAAARARAAVWRKSDAGRKYYREVRARKPNVLEYQRDWKLRKYYGITLQDWRAMAESQGGRCACCGVVDKLAVDHNHNHGTGEVRGLLCRGCNNGAGSAGDNPEILRALANYLDRTGHTPARPLSLQRLCPDPPGTELQTQNATAGGVGQDGYFLPQCGKFDTAGLIW